MMRIQPILILMLLLTGCVSRQAGKIITVNGEISADELGLTLEHEHVLVDFTRQADNAPEPYTLDEAVAHVLPFLKELQAHGVKAFVECTPMHVGRDVRLLKRLSDETGLHILTNTGFYGAQNNRFIPKQVLLMDAEAIAQFWIAEFEQGIEGTGIKPGFIKIGVDRKPLSEFHATLARAAAITHKATGLTIMAHTGPAVAAFQQLDILREEGVSPEAFIWTHASDEKDWDKLVRVARLGAWISLDKYGWKEDYREDYPRLLLKFKSEGLLHNVLLSHDAGWFDPGQPDQPFKPYTPLFDELLPRLRQEGFTDAELNQLLVTNPATAFTVKKRLFTNP
ncbi:phosphotriesterase family protein [Gaoshiqia sediminis]|uniref:Phosphotriesterase n=1 Tax=Gaoshiqia sediminis TaxID=2986998 RepID=A0AA41Y6U0_9BACT|nr:phosphotriesterase [Gaoshiqia sediminis]MCW0482925.1 phosphotriesterase [Gaoshiqia sediminis]